MSEGLLERFADHLRSWDRSDRTIRNYLADLGTFATWFEGTNGEELTPQGITPVDLREYKQYLQSIRRAKPATVNRHLAAVGALCKWARGEGMIQSSPANGIKRLDQVKAPPKALSRKEQYALLRAVLKEGRPRDYAIVQLLLQAGLRVGELCALRLADVEISERKGRAIIRQGKGQKWREVSLNADARKALSEYLATRPRVSHDFIFVGQRGEPIQPRGVQLMLARHVSSAGLEGISPHSLRHTFGKSLVDAGVSLDRVAALMGHSKLDTTALYTRPTQADLDEAMERLSLG